MKVLLPCGLTVTHLGFGCSGLMARLSRAESLRLLEAAFDSGITHFDVARMYGYGEAESVLGEFIASRRCNVTVTSKVGILPPAKTKLLSAARGFARRAAALHPAIRRAVRRRAEAMIQHGHFDVGSVENSIETSLRELRTDVLDVLLLHDCTLSDLNNAELADCLDRFKRKGLIRHFGLATEYEIAKQAQFQHPGLARVVQFPNNPGHERIASTGLTAGSTVFTHSPLGHLFAKTGPLLAADHDLAAVWSRRLGFDSTDRGRLGEAFLAAALAANPGGCVLFSSQRSTNIARNAQVQASPDIWAALRQLGARLPTATSP